jgi:integrase
MAIKKLTEGYQIDYRDAEGRRHRKSYRTLKEAQKAQRDIKTAIDQGSYVSPHKVPTLREIGAEWLSTKAGHRPASLLFWQTHLDRHLLPALGDRRLDRIDVATVEAYRDEKLAAGLSAPTVNKTLTTLTAIFAFAIHRRRCAVNPAEMAHRARHGDAELTGDGLTRKAGEPVHADEVLDPAETRRLLDAAEPGYFRTLLMTVALTGLRHDEALALQWGDLDLEVNKLTVRRSLSWAAPKGEKPRARFYPPKTKAGLRTIPIAPQLAKALKVWKLACPPSEGELVFPCQDGSPMQRWYVSKRGLKPALLRAELRSVDMHSLRHSFATSLIAAGAPVTEVQYLLGHSNPTTTLTVYSHWFKSAETGSVDRLANAVFAETRSVAVQGEL